MGGTLEVRQEQITLQAHFAKPVFGLLRDVPQLAEHLFEGLGSYGVRLVDFQVDSAGDTLGEVNLRITLQHLVTVRVFLDRVDLASTYPPFLFNYRDSSFTADFLGLIQDYSSDVSFRAFAITREVHGKLDLPVQDVLNRFSAGAPRSLGPLLGSGTVFYYGAAENRLTGSLALDFSRVVEEGLFLKMAVLYDSTQVEARDFMTTSQEQFSSLVEEIGLELTRRSA